MPAASERQRMGLAATMYYLQGETMDAVAKRLGTSRSTVSRLLKEARAQGVVQISVADVTEEHPTAGVMRQLFGVEAHVVPVRGHAPPLARLDAVASMAAQLVAGWFRDGQVLGVAWGTTVSAVVEHLPRHEIHGSTVVQLNGAATASTTGVAHVSQLLARAADAFGAEMQQFPTPAFFDYPDTKQALWRERSISRILEVQRSTDIAVFGVGAVDGDLPSHLYAGDFLSDDDLHQLRAQDVVGDVCTVFFREDGTWRDVAINARTSGPGLDVLASLPRRVCVVADRGKVCGTVGALRAGVVTDLVIDDATALAVIDHARRSHVRSR